LEFARCFGGMSPARAIVRTKSLSRKDYVELGRIV
jgi:hypothetical protein